MHYDYILIRYGEIALKGKNRHHFEDRLVQNIRNVLKDMREVKVTKTFGRIYVGLNGEAYESVIDRLKNVFGIISFSPVIKTDSELAEIKRTALDIIKSVQPSPQTFKVETKRPNKQFPFTTPEVNGEVGAYILRNTENMTVNVHNPDTQVNIEIRTEGTFIYSEVISGIGGMPAGTSGRALSLLSGGIDSPVASWFAMKRGLLLEGIHFHSYPRTSEESLQKVLDLGKALAAYSGQFRIHFVPFLEIQKQINFSGGENHNITIMRRMFLRIAEALAEKRKALALVTGESLGQVASQTLESMYVINQVVNIPIIRPLITMDKTEIIDIAREIGTFEASIRPYEDCCSLFVPKNPTTKPSLRRAEAVESKMEIDRLIAEALTKTKIFNITQDSDITAKDILLNDIEDFIK